MKTNNLIILLVVVILGGVLAVILWLKNNASKLISDSATSAITDLQNQNVNLKEVLRNTAGVVLESQTDTIAGVASDKTKNFLNRLLKR